ncbi:MAG: bifunctional tetrahydrofolate synthase/dihydrofolate synthase [gamma proteobacterium symbiont of Ctena orbiculata]|uniref:Dihydrofolate synthase/folylpolyglutamate synthase n=1 Tax=Candidatus Thiodiazotropha taylori TaxID=2792791 RepID=A0A944MC50_9GAMM|nr:bifunctional tetrahydrofolate synthase/dihydrofolate synthase [Candidatus Thiodiazotropha taylori]PUB84741.1 MAG: bifunctional tetrahydrofolate synthase/dihydrofolate synthase [gamma proteobacterium symbiont of Ctena orbiculata]MBT2989979.1 bifunctional tetrahydrofolate synthase/dihydrofolate synthase [Candidatus Thiodiazotropha taylori]MBT2998298.1 bifunctional tetrahydrofolate synthase/dihydrofolate synthase [Candidatus Thiodiazotropha taylori]MBT3002591.1 bifunctional tetrahydrofolate syn
MRFESLEQWLGWQASYHPTEIDLGLQRVATVWRRLRPEGVQSRVVTVAGTNGKGSSVAMLESIYCQAGITVGCFTSPHLVRYNERIRLNGKPVSDRQLCRAFEIIDQARERISLSYFEFATLAALICFTEEKPELIILEVGLGGRLDAVNIIDADIALITTVDLDHTDWLGDDIETIGREKAGIIRSHQPVVLGDRAMPQSVLVHAEQLDADTYLSRREFDYRSTRQGWQWQGPNGEVLELPEPGLTGGKQLQNASAVVMVCHLLQESLPLHPDAIARGLQQVRLPGRLQFVAGKPAMLLDVAHNRQSLESLGEALRQLHWQGSVYALFGMLEDKDAADAVDLIGPYLAGWHLIDLDGWRGRKAEQLAVALRRAEVKQPVSCYHGFAEAYRACREQAGPEDLMLVFGSFRIVGEAMHYLDLA